MTKTDMIKEYGRPCALLDSDVKKKQRKSELFALVNKKYPDKLLLITDCREALEDYYNRIGNTVQHTENEQYEIRNMIYEDKPYSMNEADLYCLVHLDVFKCDVQRRWDKYIAPHIKITDVCNYLEYGKDFTRVNHKTLCLGMYIEDVKDLYVLIEKFIDGVTEYIACRDICCRQVVTLDWQEGDNTHSLLWQISCRLEILPPV